MFWRKTINEMQRVSLARFKTTQDRINKISDYIQGPLQDVIDKAINNYFKELEKIIKNKNSNKKDKKLNAMWDPHLDSKILKNDIKEEKKLVIV